MPPRQRSVTPTPTPSTAPQTPRKRKSPSKRLHGTQPTSTSPKWTPSTISDALVKQLKLTFTPDPWQPFILDKIIQRFDAAICAGTSYGKSLIFEGLVVLGGPGKVVVVLCPLKALEIDQVSSACAKGIDAVTINEDTPDAERKSMWKRIRSTAEIVYISPEMALSVGFQSLWADTKFRKRLTALIIDEGHCISEWGTQKFRPEYGLLNRLRSYTGQDVPFVTCTGTCPTTTFDKIWTSLGFGCRPFWGIDVGCDRANLFFHTRIFEHPSKPTLDLLNFFPDVIDDDTKPDDLKKMLIYIDSEAACRSIRDDIRRLLPSALRSCVRAFSSDLSEAAKKQTWDELKSGQIRIVVATDAAGMGCNVDDIDIAVILGCPKSLSVVSQRWGRAGRARNSSGVCVLLVPKWAFSPKVPLAVPAIAATQGKKKNDEESKQDMKKRENLAPSLEKFINLDHNSCLHKYLREEFRPTTHLSVRQGLRTTTATSVGHRARDSPYELIWTIVDLGRVPPLIRCCGHCNPELTANWEASDEHDPRRFAFSNDFLFGNIAPPRPSSSMSASSTSSIIKPVNSRYLVSKESKQTLRRELEAWRERRHASRGGGVMFSAQVALPPKRVESLVENCRRFLQYPTIAREHVLSVIRWDSAVLLDLDEVVDIIGKWREGVVDVQTTPLSQRRASKKAKSGTASSRAPALSQPVFGSPVVALSSTMLDSQDVFWGSAMPSQPMPRYPLRDTQSVEVLRAPIATSRRPMPRPAWNSTATHVPPISSSQIPVATPPRQNLALARPTATPVRMTTPLASPRGSDRSVTPVHSTLRVPSSLRHAYQTPSGTPYSNTSYYRQHTLDSTPSSSNNSSSSTKYYRR